MFKRLRPPAMNLLRARYFKRQNIACLLHSLVLSSHNWDHKKSARDVLFIFVVAILSPPSTAIYLCKRTMQNKARLELADYEAVSTLLFLFSPRCQEALAWVLLLCLGHNKMILWISCFLSLCWERNELKQCPLGTSKKPLSNYRLFVQVIFLSCIWHNPVVCRPQKCTHMYSSATWHQQINSASKGGNTAVMIPCFFVTQLHGSAL